MQRPDILIFGPDTGIAAFQAALSHEFSGLDMVVAECDSTLSAGGLRTALLKAVGTYAPAAVIVASHALSLALDESVVAECGIPVIKTTAPLVESARLTCTRRVALLAMPETLAHADTHRQIALFAERGLRVTPVSAADLAYTARRYVKGGLLPDLMALRDLMEPIRADARIDTVVIASTHASVMRGMLEKAAFRPFYWVDGVALATRRFMALKANEQSLGIQLPQKM